MKVIPATVAKFDPFTSTEKEYFLKKFYYDPPYKFRLLDTTRYDFFLFSALISVAHIVKRHEYVYREGKVKTESRDYCFFDYSHSRASLGKRRTRVRAIDALTNWKDILFVVSSEKQFVKRTTSFIFYYNVFFHFISFRFILLHSIRYETFVTLYSQLSFFFYAIEFLFFQLQVSCPIAYDMLFVFL